jgi:hypothetical protein
MNDGHAAKVRRLEIMQTFHRFYIRNGIVVSMALMFATKVVALTLDKHGWNRVIGYTTNLGFFGHSTAETNVDMQALLASAESFAGPGILVPSRKSSLLRWCLANGLRIVQPMTLMSIGLYNEPAGAWLPSIVF